MRKTALKANLIGEKCLECKYAEFTGAAFWCPTVHATRCGINMRCLKPRMAVVLKSNNKPQVFNKCEYDYVK